MFESAGFGNRTAKSVCAEEVPKLRELLFNAQFDMHNTPDFRS
ncbi:MAG: hypothetical protein WCA64_13255 [Gallionella sp.]